MKVAAFVFWWSVLAFVVIAEYVLVPAGTVDARCNSFTDMERPCR